MMDFNREWMRRFGWPDRMHLPLAIAHRGASDYETENTIPAYRLASELFAEMWELDIRLSLDGVAVVCHYEDMSRLAGCACRISEMSWSAIRSRELPGGRRIPRLEEVVDLAARLGAGLYLEAKSEGAADASWEILAGRNYRFAAIGSFRTEWIADLRRAGCPYPLSVLVPHGVDPFDYSRSAAPDILHPCWHLAGPRPDRLVTGPFLERCRREGQAVVLWQDDRREVWSALARCAVLGVCANRPECLKPYRRSPGQAPAIVCHRGASYLAPENTLEAARICVDQGFDFVEVDIRTTADGELVAIHDPILDRTTNGSGAVAANTGAELRALDAGGWFSHAFAGAGIPSLEDLLELVRGRAGLYIEIKQAEPEQVLELIRRKNMLEAVFFSCMNLAVMRRMRALADGARLMAPRWMYPTLEAAVRDFRADIVEFAPGMDDLAEVVTCRERGVETMIYSQSQSAEALRGLLDLEPDLVNLDRPDLFKILASYPEQMERRRRVRSGAMPVRDGAAGVAAEGGR